MNRINDEKFDYGGSKGNNSLENKYHEILQDSLILSLDKNSDDCVIISDASFHITS